MIDFAVVDFGLATSFKTRDEPYYLKCGTPGFIAPEIFFAKKGTQISSTSDIFSFGIIILILLTGVFPFNSIDT